MSEQTQELALKHRPKLFKHVLGQPDAVQTIQKMVETKRVPHTILFTGPSGCGKTTLARIVKNKLECADGDFVEINAADFRGIDTVRDIRTRMNLLPLHGKCRIWLIDECHQLSKDAQNALLKALEEPPKHVYFILCTTDPNKLLKTIITRCTEIKLRELNGEVIRELIKEVAGREKLTLSEDAEEKIVECAQGSARMALVMLNKIVGVKEDEQSDLIDKTQSNKAAIDLCRLFLNPRAGWLDCAAILKELQDEPEQVRWAVLGYATSCLLKGGKITARAYQIINAFRYNYYDTKKAGLVASCYELYY